MKLKLPIGVLVLALLVVTGTGNTQQLAQKKTLTLAVAKAIAAAAEGEAAKNNTPVVIAIVDDGGNLVYLERMDDAQIGSIDVAQAKAHSAIAFKRPTKAFQDSLAGGNLAVLKVPGTIASEGGMPLTVDGKIIGAIGVSGALSQQDAAAAAVGVSALAKIAGQ
jgi:glc operon protein GlcG